MNKLKLLEDLQNQYSNCTLCPNLCKSRSQVVFGVGSPNADILVIAEAPGADEDARGIPLIGPSGRILDWFLTKVIKDERLRGLDKDFTFSGGFKRSYQWPSHETAKSILCDHIFYSNSILCRPPGNRDPELEELKNCRERLFELIYLIDPIIIIAVGKIASESLLQRKVTSILKTRGQIMDVKFPGRLTDLHYPAICTLHPAYLLRQGFNEDENGPWSLTGKDLQKVSDLIEEYKRS